VAHVAFYPNDQSKRYDGWLMLAFRPMSESKETMGGLLICHIPSMSKAKKVMGGSCHIPFNEQSKRDDVGLMSHSIQ
jgi:hypothetical protein